MCRSFLVPETTVHEAGAGEVIDHCEESLVTLGILKVEEQESLHVSLWQSDDGVEWGAKPFARFSQKFYVGTHQMVISPTAKLLQARWQVNRWGRGDLTQNFTFYIFIEPLT